MQKNNTALYILNITLRLVAICAVIAILVATVNYFAAPEIEKNRIKETKAAISKVFGIEEIDYKAIENIKVPEDQIDTVDNVYTVTDTENNMLGYCVELSPMCFKGEVNLIVAVQNDGLVKGIEITSTNSETKSIGTKVKEESFTTLFAETEENIISDNAKDYVIARSTKTSLPVAQSVITAKAIVNKIIEANKAVDDTNDTEKTDEVIEEVIPEKENTNEVDGKEEIE